MKTHTLAFIDTETTGLDPFKHELIEIGLVLVKQGITGLEVVEEYDLLIHPTRIKDADPQALRVNQYDPSEWKDAYTLEEAMQIVSQKTKDTIMVAHNVTFDYSFLEKAFQSTGALNQMHYHRLDTISIAYGLLKNEKQVDHFSLHELCKYFGIENKKEHRALSDARATFELYKKLMSL